MKTRSLAHFFIAAVLFGPANSVSSAQAANLPDSTVIDLSGQMATASVAGGLTNPVPLFVGSSAPAMFVLSLPGEDAQASSPALQQLPSPSALAPSGVSGLTRFP